MLTVLASILVVGAPDFRDPRTPMPPQGQWKAPGLGRIVWIQSPNFGKRPGGITDCDTIVIHSTVIPTLERTTVAFQRGEGQTPNPVSSHYTIGKDGSIVKNTSVFARSWHAGRSVDARGRTNLNDYSIGIELVNLNDGKDPYPEAQLKSLRAIIQTMRKFFPIKQLVSHEYIAVPSGRKNDPKGFPWEKLKDLGLPMYHGPKAP